MTPDQQNKISAAVLATCVHDPLKFVQDVYPWGVEGTELEGEKGPRAWQEDLLGTIGVHLQGPNRFDPLKLARASGHGIGKSALNAWLMQWGICTYVDAKGVVTANTESQLRTKTWPEMVKWYNLLAVKELFRVDGTVFHAAETGHEKTWRMDAIPWSANNTESFAGLHNLLKRIILLYDEASAIDDKIWEVSEGALTDENTEIIWLVNGNPTRPQGRFYQCFNLQRHRWNHKQIDARDVEGTNKKQLNDWVQDYGEDSDFVRVRVRGMFPRSGSNQLISTELVTEAQSRDVSPHISDPLIFGVDPARFGDDQSILMTRKGVSAGIHGVFKWRGLDNVQLADQVMMKIKELHPHYVFIDGGGPGGGVVDILKSRGFDVIEVSFGGKPRNHDYANKRAEMWGDTREWLKNGGCIPWSDADLAADLMNQTYSYSEKAPNPLLLTPKAAMKREGLPSPDTGDALALTFAEIVAPVTQVSKGMGDVDTAETEYEPGWV